MAVDERSLHAVLQFGAIIPPLAVWHEVRRFTPGRRFVCHASDLRVDEQPPDGSWLRAEPGDLTLDEAAQVRSVTAVLDQILIEASPQANPVILFSGGVDSGLLAARAAALGWRDTLLLHYSREEHDPETLQAREMARSLGLKFVSFVTPDAGSWDLLDRIASTYAQPFGDHSTLPSYGLGRAVLNHLSEPRVILDGTGADGCFGLFGKAALWQAVYRLPALVHLLGGWVYQSASLWRRSSGIERRLRLLRRSALMPLLSAAVAQNPLVDIAYHAPEGVRREVSRTLDHWVAGSLPCGDNRVRLSGLDLALVCGNIFAQKNKPLFDASDHRVAYPFLDSRMVRLALARAVHWPGSHESKRVLKAALARQVPHELVYRPKSGFVVPMHEKFREPRFLEAYDRLLESSAPLARLLDRRWLIAARMFLSGGRPLPAQTQNVVWAAVFTNQWLWQWEAYSQAPLTERPGASQPLYGISSAPSGLTRLPNRG
jgi:asparagine synthetase B (glutamine-hydrolysing)